jgi:carboxyl-terminal processing protease
VIPLKDSSALRLTTAKYYTPSGRAIKEEGIVPDVVVAFKEKEPVDNGKKKIEEVFEKVDDPSAVEQPAREYDNQLSAAIDLLKGIKVFKKMEKAVS